jgi:hypothetical protein
MPGALTEAAKMLGEKVSALALAVDQLDRRTNRSERITIAVIFGLALDLVLSVIVALVLISQSDINDRVSAAIAREAQTRQEALCPVYRLVVGAYNPDSRAPGPDREAYIADFKIMRDAYDKLDCVGIVVPGPTTSTPTPH